MMKNKSAVGTLVAGAVIGSLLTLGGYATFGGSSDDAAGGSEASSEKKPLYWVGPMNPNYKRDKPGKSPMGMDLIPVYEEGASGSDSGPGTIKIEPDVINNLGVRTALAKKQSLHTQIRTVGYVEYDEDLLVHVHPRVEGWVEKLYVKASGDPVEKGQPLYDIYSPELVNAQEELLLALDRKTTRLIKASENRLVALQVPDSAVERLKKTREVSQTITFYAPRGGVVDNLKIREGNFIKPGSTVMSIGTLDQVWVEAEVFERQASDVAKGLPVTMTLAYVPGKQWKGIVDYVYPTLDAKTRTLRVRLKFDNQGELLKPDMFAQVVIHAASDAPTLLVPKEAVIRTGSVDRVVLALEEGRFKSINVKIGRYDDEFAEVLSGLDEGERVVTSAQFLMDSESSKTSDFKRMSHPDHEAVKSVWVAATIDSLMPAHRMINMTHQPITEWDWPEMQMDFIVSDSVDIDTLAVGMTLHAEITKGEGEQYLLTGVHIKSENDEQVDNPHAGMDHDAMTDDGSAGEAMDHSSHGDMSEQDMSGHDMSGMDKSDSSEADKKAVESENEPAGHEGMDHSDHNG